MKEEMNNNFSSDYHEVEPQDSNSMAYTLLHAFMPMILMAIVGLVLRMM